LDHKDVKNLILQDPKVKSEYDNLDTLYNIKRQIIKLREEQGISQKELAEKIGTKQSAISRLENDDYNPSVELLDKVAHVLGKKLDIRFN
jgi:DNA-binding XRE family transcriptional regulator